jgi:hypothetical protein
MAYLDASSDFRTLTAPEALTPEALAAFAPAEDPLGWLSMFLTADPREQSTATPAWSVDLRNRVRELRDTLHSQHEREKVSALDAVREHETALFQEFLSARSSGVGRALFLPLSGGDPVAVALSVPMEHRVVLESTPFIRPLLGALQRGRGAGVVLVSRERVILWESRLGVMGHVGEYTFEADVAHWREGAAYASPQPARGQQTVSHIERFRRRLAANRGRFLEATGADIAETASERGWERVLVFGDPRLTEAVVEAMGPEGPPAVRDDRLLERAPADELASAVADRLAVLDQEEDTALADEVREQVGAGGPAVLGLGQTLDALAEGRVGHLLIDRARRWTGALAPDGRMVPEGVVPAGVEASDMRADTRMGERMIESALAQSARITVLGDAAQTLGHDDAVGALTRW